MVNADHLGRNHRYWQAIGIALALVACVASWYFLRESTIRPATPEPAPSASQGNEVVDSSLDRPANRAQLDSPSPASAAHSGWSSPCTLRGLLVDRNHNPVADASVLLEGFSGGKSDGAGAFVLNGEHSFARTYHLDIAASGFLPRGLDLELVLPPSLDLGEIVLDKGSRVSGRVLDPSGSPLAGASIRMVRDAEGRMNTLDPGIVVGRSDSNGGFALDRMPGDGIRLAAEREELRSDWTLPITIPPDGSAGGIEIVTENALQIRGRVIERGSGAGLSADVRITCTPGNWVVETKSGPDGTFSAWAGRPFSDVICMASAPGFSANGSGAATGAPGTTVETITCILTATLRALDCTVEDGATHAPLKGASLAWIPITLFDLGDACPHLLDSIQPTATADEHGRICIDTVPDPGFGAVFRADGHAPRVLHARDLVGPDVHVEMSAGGTIRVLARSDGNPTAGVRVELYAGADSNRSAEGRLRMTPKETRVTVLAADTGSNGEASFVDLAPGDYSIQVRDTAHASHPMPEVTLSAGQTLIQTLDIDQACSIAGRATRRGLPVRGLVVFARDVDQHTHKTVESSDGPYEVVSAHTYAALTDSKGGYRIDGLPSGTYDIASLGQDKDDQSRLTEEPPSVRLALRDGQTGACDLELAGTACIRGSVSLNGKPGYGMRVKFEWSVDRERGAVRFHRTCVTDVGGAFECIVPDGVRGNLVVEGDARSTIGTTLAERIGVEADDSTDAIDFDITTGLVRFAFQRGGEPAAAGGGSQLVLKPAPDSAGVPGFSKAYAWFLGPRGRQNCEWTLPVGSFVVYLQAAGGAARVPGLKLAVKSDETTTLTIELDTPK